MSSRRVPFEERIDGALRKAYARPNRSLRGIPTSLVQTMIARGLVVTARRGSAECHALSAEGERRAADLLRANLAEPSRSTVVAPPAGSPGLIGERAAFAERLLAFLADEDAGAATLKLPLSGWRVKLERSGGYKLILRGQRALRGDEADTTKRVPADATARSDQ
jgi:hypothetical protein